MSTKANLYSRPEPSPFDSRLAVAPPGYRSPRRKGSRIGAQATQYGEVGPGAPQAPANDLSLSPAYDWTAFDQFAQTNAPKRVRMPVTPEEDFFARKQAGPTAAALRAAGASMAPMMPAVGAAMAGAAGGIDNFATSAMRAKAAPRPLDASGQPMNLDAKGLPVAGTKRLTPDGRFEVMIDSASGPRWIGYIPSAAEAERAKFGPGYAALTPEQKAAFLRGQLPGRPQGMEVGRETVGPAGMVTHRDANGNPTSQEYDSSRDRELNSRAISANDRAALGVSPNVDKAVQMPDGSIATATFSPAERAANEARQREYRAWLEARQPGSSAEDPFQSKFAGPFGQQLARLTRPRYRPVASDSEPLRRRGCEHGGARRRRGLCRTSWRAA